ncbi:hypothetical protein L6164_003593 [Bauhinia variegata]|uniref:Uncharacterized protein n=1 Tax=Bauhinia variegata TaxID=167791 RepID=A0ACB9Q2D4_BAUVA|nr:hypothetical protein L6164_003593 [Bauhinia variegata]
MFKWVTHFEFFHRPAASHHREERSAINFQFFTPHLEDQIAEMARTRGALLSGCRRSTASACKEQVAQRTIARAPSQKQEPAAVAYHEEERPAATDAAFQQEDRPACPDVLAEPFPGGPEDISILKSITLPSKTVVPETTGAHRRSPEVRLIRKMNDMLKDMIDRNLVEPTSEAGDIIRRMYTMSDGWHGCKRNKTQESQC